MGFCSVKTAGKLNFGLRITGRRNDGLHVLETHMAPISVFDQLVFRVEQKAGSSRLLVDCEGGDLGCQNDNLVHRAGQMFMDRVGVAANVSVQLIKRIPVGAGLGGGSSDAASTLVVLNRMFGSPVPREELLNWAAEVGADVSFFLRGTPALVRGVGEEVVPLSMNWSSSILVAYPGFALPTHLVYETFDRTLTLGTSQSKRTSFSDSSWPTRTFLENDLQNAAFSIRPELQILREKFIQLGAETCVMSGSGSALFGIWKRRSQLRVAARVLHAQGVWARVVDVLPHTRYYVPNRESV